MDQRITADLDSFATGTAEVYGNLLKPTTELMLFSWKISQSIGGSRLAIFMMYGTTSRFPATLCPFWQGFPSVSPSPLLLT